MFAPSRCDLDGGEQDAGRVGGSPWPEVTTEGQQVAIPTFDGKHGGGTGDGKGGGQQDDSNSGNKHGGGGSSEGGNSSDGKGPADGK